MTTMHRSTVETLRRCWEKLTTELVAKQEELRIREASCGKSHDVRKMSRLRTDIDSLEKRLARCER